MGRIEAQGQEEEKDEDSHLEGIRDTEMKCPLKPMPPDKFFDPKILKIGAKFEREHTTSDRVAKEIVKGHILEFPLLKHRKLTTDYYKHLAKLEKKLSS